MRPFKPGFAAMLPENFIPHEVAQVPPKPTYQFLILVFSNISFAPSCGNYINSENGIASCA